VGVVRALFARPADARIAAGSFVIMPFTAPAQ
jgi:hypothetical protein